MELISLIFTILGVLLGIAGIVVSILCWKHNYKELQQIKSLKKMSLFTESGFTDFNSKVLKLLKEDPEAANPFKLTEELTEESIKATIFNMCQNTLKDTALILRVMFYRRRRVPAERCF